MFPHGVFRIPSREWIDDIRSGVRHVIDIARGDCKAVDESRGGNLRVQVGSHKPDSISRAFDSTPRKGRLAVEIEYAVAICFKNTTPEPFDETGFSWIIIRKGLDAFCDFTYRYGRDVEAACSRRIPQSCL